MSRLYRWGLIGLILLWYFTSTKIVYGQVVINEFSSNSDPEWVELYNTSDQSIDITGWQLTDEANHEASLSGVINERSYFAFDHSGGWLNNSGGDSIILKDTSGSVKDTITYGKSGSVVGTPDADKSSGRVPDGSQNWVKDLSWTKGQANPQSVVSPTPTPVPTPAPSPEPSPEPSASSQIQMTTSSSPQIKKVSPSPVTKQTSPHPSQDIGEVLAATRGLTVDGSPNNSLDLTPAAEKPSFTLAGMFLIGGGILFSGTAGLLLYFRLNKPKLV